MGTLETPQDRHRYIHRTGSPEWNRQTEVQVEQGAREAMAEQGARGGHGGTASETAAPAPTSVSSAGALLPPPKISLGKLGVSGALRGEHTKTVKKTVVTDWSITATAGWLVNTAAAGWGYHDRLDNNGSSRLA